MAKWMVDLETQQPTICTANAGRALQVVVQVVSTRPVHPPLLPALHLLLLLLDPPLPEQVAPALLKGRELPQVVPDGVARQGVVPGIRDLGV